MWATWFGFRWVSSYHHNSALPNGGSQFLENLFWHKQLTVRAPYRPRMACTFEKKDRAKKANYRHHLDAISRWDDEIRWWRSMRATCVVYFWSQNRPPICETNSEKANAIDDLPFPVERRMHRKEPIRNGPIGKSCHKSDDGDKYYSICIYVLSLAYLGIRNFTKSLQN